MTNTTGIEAAGEETSGTAARPSAQSGPAAAPEIVQQVSDLLRPQLRDPQLARQTAVQIVAVAETHSGPLPHPDSLARYEAVLPGSARDILAMAMREQKHRHRMTIMENIYPYCGLLIAALTLVGCLGGAAYLALHERTTVALACIGAPLLGTVGWLLNARLTTPAPVATPASPELAAPEPGPRRR